MLKSGWDVFCSRPLDFELAGLFNYRIRSWLRHDLFHIVIRTLGRADGDTDIEQWQSS